MILPSVGMILADTSRSRVYLQALLHSDLKLEKALLLMSEQNRPGQSQNAAHAPLKTKLGTIDLNEPVTVTLQRMKTPCTILEDGDINSLGTISALAKCPCQVLVYSGFGGVLLRDEVLACGKDFLHVHGGYLPDYKGSTTNYYSYLTDGSCGASAIFMTAKLDSGPVLLRRKFFPNGDIRELDYALDSYYRAEVLCEVLAHYATNGFWMREQFKGDGRVFFIMHPLLRHVAIVKSIEKNNV